MADPQTVARIADELIGTHLGADEWTFGFDRAVRRAGACDARRRRITVSKHLAAGMDEQAVRQVLLHEIAHALAGHRAGHGPQWRAVARGLGYTGQRLWTGEAAAAQARWVGTCPAGHEHLRFRRATRPLSCGRCSRSFSRAALITWRLRDEAPADDGRPGPAASATTPGRPMSAAARVTERPTR